MYFFNVFQFLLIIKKSHKRTIFTFFFVISSKLIILLYFEIDVIAKITNNKKKVNFPKVFLVKFYTKRSFFQIIRKKSFITTAQIRGFFCYFFYVKVFDCIFFWPFFPSLQHIFPLFLIIKFCLWEKLKFLTKKNKGKFGILWSSRESSAELSSSLSKYLPIYFFFNISHQWIVNFVFSSLVRMSKWFSWRNLEL